MMDPSRLLSRRRADPDTDALHERVAELEQRLDHERLYPMEWVNRRVRDRLGNEVTAGPFAGMRFPDWGLTGIDAFSPRVIGSYEEELHDAVEVAIATQPPVVVNVGSAEGYYAVGLARRLPQATVHAYDTNPLRIERLLEIAELNGVTVEGHAAPATHDSLAGELVPGSLVVCDCDGPEDELLDPVAVPVLRECTLIIEAHDLLKPGITPRLMAAFESSHEIERIDTRPRFTNDYPQLGDLPLVTRQMAISEYREDRCGSSCARRAANPAARPPVRPVATAGRARPARRPRGRRARRR